MALTSNDGTVIDNSNPYMQQTQAGTELYNLSVGVGFTLPTSDPGVAGQLWSNSGVVTVSAG